MILALDPGSSETGWCLFDDGRVVDSGVGDNHDVLVWVREGQGAATLAIEFAESFGQKVWSQVFTAVRWTGRFQQAWRAPDEVLLVTRSEVKLHLLGKRAGNDQQIRQALLDLVGPPGTKKAPGPTYGIKSHAWAALGVAVTAHYQLRHPMADGARQPSRLQPAAGETRAFTGQADRSTDESAEPVTNTENA